MWKIFWLTVLTVVVAVVVVSIQYYHPLQHWGAYETGSQNTAGTPPNYNYWSGFGSVFPWELGLFVSVWAWMITHYRLNNCHIEKCPWIGKYPVAGGHYKVCRKHHPEAHVRHKKVSFEHVQHVHALHLLKTGMIHLPDSPKDTT
jgi:hypothetical protein